MFALVVRFELKDDKSADAFDTLVEETAQEIATREPGTLVYTTHTVDGAPLSRVFYELYRDRSAFDEHERQPHIVRFLSERDHHVSSTRVEFVSPVTAKGIAVNG